MKLTNVLFGDEITEISKKKKLKPVLISSKEDVNKILKGENAS